MKLHLSDVGKIWIRVRNRPTKRLEPASNRRSSRNDWCVCRDQLVHIRPPAPAPRKKWCFGGNLQIFHFCTLEMGTFPKHVQKPNLSVFEPIHFEPGVFCFYLEFKIEPYFPKWCYTNKNKEHNNSKMSLFWNILAKTCLYRILYRPIWTCLSRYGPQSPGLLSADMSRYGPVSFWIPMVLDTNGFQGNPFGYQWFPKGFSFKDD